MQGEKSFDSKVPVYDEEQILNLQEIVKSVDGFDNVAVFYYDSGRVVPYEHIKRQNQQRGQRVITFPNPNLLAMFRTSGFSR